MDQYSVQEPLLSSQGVKKKPLFVSSAKWVLKILIWVIFIAWVVFIFVYPTQLGNEIFEKCIGATKGTPFGLSGSIFLLLSGPILLIAILAIAHLIISGEEDIQQYEEEFKVSTCPLVDISCSRGWTIWVVSAAEFIGILLFVVYIIWAVYAYTIRNLSLISIGFTSKEEGLQMEFYVAYVIWVLQHLAIRIDRASTWYDWIILLGISIPSGGKRISSSPPYDIPFEHATRYHVWLGHLTMLLFTLHGLFYVIDGNAGLNAYVAFPVDNGMERCGIANFAGVVSLLAGLLMWVTSLPACLWWNISFHADRFLRFCQSRRTVDVVSAKCHPCGTVELVFSKPGNLRYNALSFVFLQIRELSWLQWHPFSVSSSPLDGKNHLSILIKVLGRWTEKLRENIMKTSEVETAKLLDQPFQPHAKITASVEGPYGHEVPYHLIPCLPKNVLVIWAVKKSNELPLLSTINMESICPYISDKLNLEICIYVTRETDPQLEEGIVHKATTSSICTATKGYGMSVLVGTGDNIWSGLYIICSTVGFVSLLGCVVGLWHLWERKTLAREEHLDNGMKAEKVPDNEDMTNDNFFEKKHSSFTVIQYGSRPDFKEILGCVSKRWGFVDVGVIICGPPTLQCSVAREIRSQNLRRESDDPVFHFHSHSFDL
ncbi:hypothetical protein GH714_019165 [Hevea brasiliensis]|uniref:FAD-binding FR-type domain-containing protein n=1 Tax=Hevea brasiliensis TaxID=3981 RepID=A0A6A6MYM4_HEVBR|nr:hypothetical protein GH714_019165 [Hevea brasiliensis]